MIYKGQVIRECERGKGEHPGKWIIAGKHPVDRNLADELCPHFYTIRGAKAAINALKSWRSGPAHRPGRARAGGPGG